MRRPSPYVAVVMIYLMTPGGGELTESIIHLLSTGHLAHALDGAEHTVDGEEHGCSGPFHVCLCHASTPFTVRQPQTDVEATSAASASPTWPADDPQADGHAHGVFRPPMA